MSSFKNLYFEKSKEVELIHDRALLEKAIPELRILASKLREEEIIQLLNTQLLTPQQDTIQRLLLHERLPKTIPYIDSISDTLLFAVPIHVRAGVDLVCSVVDSFTQLLLNVPYARFRREAAAIVESLIKKLHDEGFDKQCLTPLHTYMLLLRMSCCRRDILQDVLSVARLKFTNAHNPKKYSLSILLFFYYSGIVFSWAKDYEAAERSFELVYFSPPLEIPSWVVVCAFRKLILISLILHGCVNQFVLQRARLLTEIRSYGENTNITRYLEWAESYRTLRLEDVEKGLKNMKMIEMLKADGNLGLAKVARDEFMRHLVNKMRSLYTACTLKQMLNYAGLGENQIEGYSESLRVTIKRLQASDAGVSFMDLECTQVKFEDVSSRFNTKESVVDLQQRVSRVLCDSRVLDEKRESIVYNSQFTASRPGGDSDGVQMILDDDGDDDFM